GPLDARDYFCIRAYFCFVARISADGPISALVMPSLAFFCQITATTEFCTLSLHDALPISWIGNPSPSRSPWPASAVDCLPIPNTDRKSTRLNSSHVSISYAVFCLKKKKDRHQPRYVVERVLDSAGITDQ